MSKTLVLEIPDDVFVQFQKVAESKGKTAEKFVTEIMLKNIPSEKKKGGKEAELAEKRFAKWIGAVNSGNPRSADNGQIDADLAEEYGRDL
ncbi:MAG: hypothetical protein AAB336_11350 [Acidobacteriota bacterium]